MTAVIDSLAFDEPNRSVFATRIDQIKVVLDLAEREARAGSYVVVMISYEAAPAFDSALSVDDSNGFPLAYAAVYSEPSNAAETCSNVSASPWIPAVTKHEYNQSVARIHELIATGHTYQVNYSFPLTSTFSGDSLAWYEQLCQAQRARYSAYLDLGRYKVLSLSPELFFERRGDHVVTVGFNVQQFGAVIVGCDGFHHPGADFLRAAMCAAFVSDDGIV